MELYWAIGQWVIIMEDAFFMSWEDFGSLDQISSVINGIYGCNNSRETLRTVVTLIQRFSFLSEVRRQSIANSDFGSKTRSFKNSLLRNTTSTKKDSYAL
jgi:hypothetical protein